MADICFECGGALRRSAGIILLVCFAAACALLPLAAQQQGSTGAPSGAPKALNTSGDEGAQGSTLGPPAIPVEEIIRQFTARESEFKLEREQFIYTQTFVFQTLDDSNRVDGEYKMTSDITFNDRGKRVEVVTYAPTPTLERLSIEKEDLDDLENLYPFALTAEDSAKYDIKYVDHVQLDELTTYVFDVAPKTLEKNQRYFQGRIWVDDKDFGIVKSFGKPAYAKSKRTENSAFPRFETFRENIEGKYWFPTYTRANEVLRFKQADDVHIRLTVRYENYKRFGVTVKIGPATKVPDQPKK